MQSKTLGKMWQVTWGTTPFKEFEHWHSGTNPVDS